MPQSGARRAIVRPARVALLFALILAMSMVNADVLDEAVTLIEKGDVRAAELVMKQGLQDKPDDPELRFLLGKLYLDAGSLAAAEKELRLARSHGMPDEMVLHPLGRAYLLQEKYAQVLAEIPDESGHGDALRAQVLTLRALASLGIGERAAADDALKTALGLAPDHRDALVAQARLLLAGDDAGPGQRAAARLVKRFPGCAECWQLLGDAEQKMGNAKAADIAYARTLEFDADNFPAMAARAAIALGRGDVQTARVLIDAARGQRPDAHLVAFLEASLAYQQGNLERAQEWIPKAFNAKQESIPTILLDGLIAQAAGRPAQARERLRQVLAVAADNRVALKALALLEFDERRHQAVVDLLEPVVERGEDDADMRAMLAGAQTQLGNSARAVELMLAVAGQGVGMQVQTAASRLAGGDVEAGLEGLKRAAENHPEATRPAFLAAIGLLQQERFDEALSTAETLLARQPANPAYLNLVGAAQLGKGDLDAAEASFRKTVATQGGFLPARHNLVRVALLRDDIDAALAELGEILKLDDGDADALLQRARIEAAIGQADVALDTLRGLLVKHPDHRIAARILAENLLRRGDVQGAADIARGLLRILPDDVDGQLILARAFLADEAPADAVTMLKQAAQSRPNEAEIQALLGEAALAAGEREAANAAFARAAELAPDDIGKAARPIELALADGKLDEAELALRRLRLRHPLKAAPYELAGDLWMARGDAARAFVEYELAALREPSARLLFKQYQARPEGAGSAEALAPLREWLLTHPEDNVIRLFVAAELERVGDPGVAALYEEVLRQDPNNVFALNNLAMRSLDRDPVVALTYAELAHELSADDPIVLDTYAQTLMAAQRPAEAVPLLEKAVELLKNEPELRFNLARALAANRQFGEARDQLRRVLITYPDYPRKAEIMTMLESLRTQ